MVLPRCWVLLLVCTMSCWDMADTIIAGLQSGPALSSILTPRVRWWQRAWKVCDKLLTWINWQFFLQNKHFFSSFWRLRYDSRISFSWLFTSWFYRFKKSNPMPTMQWHGGKALKKWAWWQKGPIYNQQEGPLMGLLLPCMFLLLIWPSSIVQGAVDDTWYFSHAFKLFQILEIRDINDHVPFLLLHSIITHFTLCEMGRDITKIRTMISSFQ